MKRRVSFLAAVLALAIVLSVFCCVPAFAAGNTRTFTMPASGVTVSATFEGAPFAITTVCDPTNGGTVVVSGDGVATAENETTAKAGSEVTLTATPAAGFELGSVTVTKASGGAVTVKINGKLEVLSIDIQPEIVDPDDIETLADILTAGVNEAIKKVNAANSDEMGRLTGGLNMPGVPGLF